MNAATALGLTVPLTLSQGDRMKATQCPLLALSGHGRAAA